MFRPAISRFDTIAVMMNASPSVAIAK